VSRERWEAVPQPPAPSPASQAGPSPTRPKTGRWKRLSEVTAKPVRWLWEPWLPRGKLTVIEGDPGCGKSTLTAALAAAVTTGAEGIGPAAGVVLVNLEDDPADTTLPRVLVNDGDARRVLIPRVSALRIPDDVPDLLSAVQQIEAGLVVIDPLTQVLMGDGNKDQDVRQSLEPLVNMARDTGAAVVLVRHLRKGGGPAMYAGGGSIAITAAARCVLRVAVHPDDPDRRVLAMVKTNVGPTPRSVVFAIDHRLGGRVVWEDEDCDLTADDLDTHYRVAKRRAASPDRLAGATAFLLELLTDGDVPASDVTRAAESAGHSKATVRRAFKGLEGVARKDGFAGHWVWSLPDSDR
jgi:energy-coupling factor transporter ATP-binding protein EcfA2